MTERPTEETAAAGPMARSARLRAGISLRAVAARIGVSPATLSAIETGKTPLTVDRLQAIARALGTSVVEILSSTAESEQPQQVASGAGGENADWQTFPALELDPVLAGAIAVFVRTGYHGATMRTIADAVGMSVPGVYHHYPSKQHLIVAVLDVAMAELHWRVPAARAAGTTPTQRFANMVEALALFHTHRRDIALIGASEMRSIESPDRERIAVLRNRIQYMLDEEVEAGLRAGEFRTPHPHNAARAVATMCTSLPQWFRPVGPTSASEIALEYARFACDMMRGR